MSVIDRLAGWVDHHTGEGGPLQTYLHGQQAVAEADARAEAYRSGLYEGLNPDQLYDDIYGRGARPREDAAEDTAPADDYSGGEADADEAAGDAA